MSWLPDSNGLHPAPSWFILSVFFRMKSYSSQYDLIFIHKGQIRVTIWLAFKWQLLKSPSISLSASRWQYWRIGGLCICSSVFLFLEKSVDGFEEVDIEEMEVWARRTPSVWRNVGICRDTRLCWAPQGDRDVVSIWTNGNFHLLRRKRKNY